MNVKLFFMVPASSWRGWWGQTWKNDIRKIVEPAEEILSGRGRFCRKIAFYSENMEFFLDKRRSER